MQTIGSNLLRVILAFTLVVPAFGRADVPPISTRTNLSEAQARAIVDASARARDLEWRVFTAHVDGRPRSVVLLGEHHLALAEDLQSAKTVIDQFEYLATENGLAEGEDAWNYRATPILALGLLPIYLGMMLVDHRESTSPMRLARDGARVKSIDNAERLHRPTASEERQVLFMGLVGLGMAAAAGAVVFSGLKLIFGARTLPRLKSLGAAAGAFVGFAGSTAVFYPNEREWPIVKNRDVSIARYIAGWIKTSGDAGPLLVILGKLHLPNIGEFLTKQYGFEENPVTEALP